MASIVTKDNSMSRMSDIHIDISEFETLLYSRGLADTMVADTINRLNALGLKKYVDIVIQEFQYNVFHGHIEGF